MARLGGSTVYDRMKKTGYITGPHHAMGPALDEMTPPPATPPDDNPGTPGADANAGEDQGAGQPPNLRDAGDSPGSCGDCEHFGSDDGSDTGAAVCKQFGNTPVTANQVCDAYEPKGASNGEEEGPGSQAAPVPEAG